MTTSVLSSAALFASALAITDARVEVGDGTVLERATVVVDGDRIVAVGPDAPVPRGATIVDGQGLTVTPGLIEIATQLGLVEIDAEPVANDALVMTPFAPSLRPFDGYRSDSTRLPVARKGGVTHVLMAPSGGILSGTGVVIPLDGRALDPKARPAALLLDVDEGGKLVFGRSRPELWARLREIFDDARFYRAKKAAFDGGAARPLSLPPRELEALAPVLDGTVPLLVTAESADDLRVLFAFLDEQAALGAKLRVIVVGGREAHQVGAELARRRIPVVVTPGEQIPDRFDALDARDDNPALLHAMGVDVILSTRAWANNAGRLRQEAGIAVAHGLPRDRALAAITSAPARALGLDGEQGTIAVGKRAHLVVWSGDPLELSTRALHVVIDGRETPLATRHDALAERYRARPRR